MKRKELAATLLLTLSVMLLGGCSKADNGDDIVEPTDGGVSIEEVESDDDSEETEEQRIIEVSKELIGPEKTSEVALMDVDAFTNENLRKDVGSIYKNIDYFVYCNKVYFLVEVPNEEVQEILEKAFRDSLSEEDMAKYEKLEAGVDFENMTDAELTEYYSIYFEMQEKLSDFQHDNFPNLWEQNEGYIDRIISVNFDGSDFRIVAEDGLLRQGEYMCTCGDCAYYYTYDYTVCVNLLTGEVHKLDKNYIFIGDVDEGGYVKAMISDDKSYEYMIGLYTYDLVEEKEITSNEVKCNYSTCTYFDYENMDIYYIDENDSYEYCLGKNGTTVCTFENDESPDIILGVDGDIAYAFEAGSLYKINMADGTKTVTKEDKDYMWYISTYKEGPVYLNTNTDGDIYMFDAQKGQIEELVKEAGFFHYANEWNSKLYFTSEASGNAGEYDPATGSFREIQTEGTIKLTDEGMFSLDETTDSKTQETIYNFIQIA